MSNVGILAFTCPGRYGPNPSLAPGSVLNETSLMVRPWKHISAEMMTGPHAPIHPAHGLAQPSGGHSVHFAEQFPGHCPREIPFFTAPHFLQSLTAVSAASPPLPNHCQTITLSEKPCHRIAPVHWEHRTKAKQVGYVLRKAREGIIIKSTRAQCTAIQLPLLSATSTTPARL